MTRFHTGVLSVVLTLIIAALGILMVMRLPSGNYGVVTAFCQQVREKRELNCATQLENAFMDAGGSNYTRSMRIRDERECRRVGETVFLACKQDNGE